MKKITLLLDDEALCKSIEEEAKSASCTDEEVVIRALYFWQTESELDAEDKQELDEARKEWQENGGMEASEFFHGLREEENAAGL